MTTITRDAAVSSTKPHVRPPVPDHPPAASQAWADDQPSSAGFVTMLAAFRASGGTAPADVLGKLLQDQHSGSPALLAQWISEGQLLALRWRGNIWLPMFQLKARDLTIKPGPLQVRAQLPALWTPWATAAWFTQPNHRLGGQAPVDLLDLDLRAVYNAARSWRPDDGLLPASPLLATCVPPHRQQRAAPGFSGAVTTAGARTCRDGHHAWPRTAPRFKRS